MSLTVFPCTGACAFGHTLSLQWNLVFLVCLDEKGNKMDIGFCPCQFAVRAACYLQIIQCWRLEQTPGCTHPASIWKKAKLRRLEVLTSGLISIHSFIPQIAFSLIGWLLATGMVQACSDRPLICLQAVAASSVSSFVWEVFVFLNLC